MLDIIFLGTEFNMNENLIGVNIMFRFFYNPIFWKVQERGEKVLYHNESIFGKFIKPTTNAVEPFSEGHCVGGGIGVENMSESLTVRV